MQEVRTYYYQDGNTVRKADVQVRPNRYLPTREQRRLEKLEEAARTDRMIERIKAAALRRNRLLTMYMITSVLVACIMLVFYVSLQNSVTTRMNNIANLENQLSELNADNGAAESRIATTTNLSEIKDRAMNELGMVYATRDQIVYYSVDSSDYMSQYYDIP